MRSSCLLDIVTWSLGRTDSKALRKGDELVLVISEVLHRAIVVRKVVVWSYHIHGN